MLPTAASAENCQLKLVSSLTLMESGDHLVVSVAIDGKELKFILELGSAYSGLTTDHAKEFSLAESSMPRNVTPTVDDQPITKRVTVPALEIDRLVAHDVKLFEIPLLRDADGILGLDILATDDLELDLAHHKINLFSRDHCSGKVIYWNPPGGAVAVIPLTIQKTGHIMTNMSVDGKLLTVEIIMTPRSTMGMNVAHRLFGIDARSPNIVSTEKDSKGLPIYHYPFHQIDVEGLRIQNPDIAIAGEVSEPECNPHETDLANGKSVRCYGGANLYLGWSVLKKLHLFFAFREQMLYATASS